MAWTFGLILFLWLASLAMVWAWERLMEIGRLRFMQTQPPEYRIGAVAWRKIGDSARRDRLGTVLPRFQTDHSKA